MRTLSLKLTQNLYCNLCMGIISLLIQWLTRSQSHIWAQPLSAACFPFSLRNVCESLQTGSFFSTHHMSSEGYFLCLTIKTQKSLLQQVCSSCGPRIRACCRDKALRTLSHVSMVHFVLCPCLCGRCLNPLLLKRLY